MRLQGKLQRDGRWWIAEIPLLDVMTQGRTRAEAFEMVADLLVTIVNRPAFSATVHPGPGRSFEVSGSDTLGLVAILLRRARVRSGLSLADVSRNLGSSSRNAYARYEQGRTAPTVDKLAELLRAVECDVVLRLSGAAGSNDDSG